MSIYDFTVLDKAGNEVSLKDYEGKVVLIVNTASKCGLTPQFEGLEALYQKYKEQGLVVLGFPSNQFGSQDPGSNEEIQTFCKINYGVTFPVFGKVDVREETAIPLYKYLVSEKPFRGMHGEKGERLFGILQEKYPEKLVGDDIKWNFTKFLVDREGNIVERFEPSVAPEELDAPIAALI